MSRIKSAASVILVRGDATDPEVYLARRAPELKFFGNYWVFPGGNLSALDRHAEDDTEELTLKRCAVRELLEEADVLSASLGQEFSPEQKQTLKRQIKDEPEQWRAFLAQFDPWPDLLTPCYRLTTPPFFPVRYDTLFLYARCPQHETPAVDEYELVEGDFFRPQQALDAWERGAMDIAPPTLFLLRLLADGAEETFFARCKAETERLEQGGLQPSWFSPGVFVAPLATPTLPPATTTNTIIAGVSKLYIIDPATPDAAEQQRLFNKMDEMIGAGATFAAILLTHHHEDHVGAVNAVSQRYQLPLRAHEETCRRIRVGYLPGEPLTDGDQLELGVAPDGSGDWHLKVLHTPGHAPDHLCFIDSRYHAAIVGDMLSTVSTILIDPPEGHLRTYLHSLNRLLDTPMRVLFPAHGPPQRDGHSLIRRFLRHRQKREDAVRAALSATPASVAELLPEVYADLAADVYPIAARSLLAGLIKLEEDGFCKQQDGAWMLR